MTIDALNSTPLESSPSKELCSILTIPCKKPLKAVSNNGFIQISE